MQKLIHKCLFISFLLTFLEAAIGITLFFFAWFGYLEESQTEVFFSLFAVTVLIDFLFSIVVLTNLANAKSKSDISALKVLGNDIEAAYRFGKIGLIITDDNDKVIWVNSLFKDIEKSLVDADIYEFFTGLKPIRDGASDEISFYFDNVYYLVRYIKKAHLYIFKDNTELRYVYDENERNKPAIGIISIDNYQDIANSLDDVSMNDNLVSVQNVVVEYAKENNMFLKKYKNDAYLFVCDNESYNKILSEQVSLLDAIKNDKADNPLTLSIGIASGINSYSRLYEMASKALDVALSRGGAQAVASTYGSNLQFFGGTTETKEKKNSVQSRIMSNSLKALIEGAKHVYIMGHITADLDAIGSSLGLYVFVKGVADIPVKIVYDEFKLEEKTKKAFKGIFTREEIADMTISPSKASDDITDQDLLICTDFHSPASALDVAMGQDQKPYSKLIKKAAHIAIIDHHRMNGNPIERPEISYIEPSASSASELVTELIRYSTVSIEIPPRIATFLLSGIILDTNYYRNHIGARTYDASYVLKTFGADNAMADSFLKIELEEYVLKNAIMAKASNPRSDVLLASVPNNDPVQQALLARVAQEALQISGIKASFVVGKVSDKEVGVSSRSDGTISCQLICEKLNGGGSFTMAAARIKNDTIENVRKRLEELIKEYGDGVKQKKILGGEKE